MKEAVKWVLSLSLVFGMLFVIIDGGYRLQIVSGSQKVCSK